MSAEAAAALISGTFLLLVAFIERGRRENSRDHNRTIGTLTRIEHKLDEHIGDHARAGMNQKDPNR